MLTDVCRFWLTFLAAGIFLLASPTRGQEQADRDVADVASRGKRVFVIGDSISMGWQPFLAQELDGIASVSRPQQNERNENCAGTTRGVARIAAWLDQADAPDLILFNFGLHDMKHVNPEDGKNSNDPAHPRQAEPEIYERQLAQIVDQLEKTGARLIFLTTTPVPSGGVKPLRRMGDPLLYNALARRIMDARGIEVIDLYSPALEFQTPWQQPANVHFTKEGSSQLAGLIAKRVRPWLASQATTAGDNTADSWQADPELVQQFSENRPGNYSENQVPEYRLPELSEDRNATIKTFEDLIYGRPPSELADANQTWTRQEQPLPADARPMRVSEFTLTLTTAGDRPLFEFPFLLFCPTSTEPCPVIVLIHNREYPALPRCLENPIGFLPVEMLIQQGYAVAVVHTNHVDPDRKDAGGEGIRIACQQVLGDDPERADAWGALAAWAWGASRVVDVLTECPEIDSKRVAVIGHSRGGKTALWAAATDPRIAAAISNNSGCAGAALSRREFGETLPMIASRFPWWFAPAFQSVTEADPAELPVDQHQLIGLIAPRAVAVGSASDDLWADPQGEYLAWLAALPQFRDTVSETDAIDEGAWSRMPALGDQRRVGRASYHIRSGAHNLTEVDWLHYLTFLGEVWNRESDSKRGP